MNINFYPDRDDKRLETAAEEYSKIWSENGDKIIFSIEKISKLKFKNKFFNTIIYKEPYGWSYPLGFSYKHNEKQKFGALAHELSHRLFYQHKIKPKKRSIKNTHKLLNLILYMTSIVI